MFSASTYLLFLTTTTWAFVYRLVIDKFVDLEINWLVSGYMTNMEGWSFRAEIALGRMYGGGSGVVDECEVEL